MFALMSIGNSSSQPGISSNSSYSCCVSLSCCRDRIVAGFSNGSILYNTISSSLQSSGHQVAMHSCPPTALVLTSTNFICAGGSDGRILFIELNSSTDSASSGIKRSNFNNQRVSTRSSTSSTTSAASISSSQQTIEWGNDLSCGQCSPSGTVLILCSRDNMLIFELERDNSKVWQHKMVKQTKYNHKNEYLFFPLNNQTVNLTGIILITGLCWSSDGTRLICASLNGAVELFRCRWKSKLIGSRFEVNFIGTRQVVINDLQEKYSSTFTAEHDIHDVKIIGKRPHAVIWTENTLIMACIISGSSIIQSEIEWHGLTKHGVRFSFDYENVVLISAVGELFLVQLGQNKILRSVRTDFTSPHLLSVRIQDVNINNETQLQRGNNSDSVKVFAYLLDAQTISVIDLVTGLQLCIWSHSQRIDWMELNESGTKLIYRDKTLKLLLLNIVSHGTSSSVNNSQSSPFEQCCTVLLMNNCAFVQWVPGTDVLVCQCKDKLYVWYDLMTSPPVIHSIVGGEMNEVLDIERANGLTTVRMTMANSDIVLDEVLLEFDTAIDDGDLER